MKRDFFSSFPLFCGFFTVDFKISCEFKNTKVKFGAIPVMGMRNEKNKREFLVPLKKFDNKNLALNFLNK